MIFDKNEDDGNHLLRRTAFALTMYAALLTTSMTAIAQGSDKVIPMGEWAEFINVNYVGKPLLVHLRTGYERAIMFPERVAVKSINNIPVNQGVTPELPNCTIELDTDVIGFAPLERFGTQQVEVTGLQSGRVYTLLVSSSPNGKRQPIHIRE